ncbi:hypothetical protein VTL71DRAFT_11114 [Oculimacula yallundae]|uniref:Uncharacterized protein n=1 Tax=Oculimacula yallundae TaxID=86028 RepID=A0ABR4CV28_9HELO
MSSVAYGLLYLLTEALSAIYIQALLNFTEKHASLSFIPIGIGMALNILPSFYDHFLLKRIKAQCKVIKPEHKIRGFAIAAPLLAIALTFPKWTIPPALSVPRPVSFLPLILIGYAANEFNCTLSGYLTDSYTIFSASALSSMAFLRAVLSSAFPLFTRQMYEDLGANRATTVLAAAENRMSVSRERQESKASGSSDEATLVGDGDVEALAEQLAEREKRLGDIPGVEPEEEKAAALVS